MTRGKFPAGRPPSSSADDEGGGKADAPSEGTLVARLQAGDPAVLDEILEQYWAPVLRYAMGLVGSYDEAEDIAQDAFCSLWERRGRWLGSTQLAPLLFRITRNRCLASQRSAAVRNRHAHSEAKGPASRPPTPLQVTEAAEFRQAIAEAVERLPDRQREVFRLSRVQGLSCREIATVLDLSAQTVANHLTAALRTLREGLAPHLDRHSGRPRLRVSGSGDGAR